MDPLPQVEEVQRSLAELLGEPLDVVGRLRAIADLAVRVLPSCVGVSVTLLLDGEPVTVTATGPVVEQLDAVQYLVDGPCVESARSQQVLPILDVLDEDRWEAFAQAAAARGVRSTLSIPLLAADGSVLGALNLYAGDQDGFRGAAALAEAFGSSVGLAVTNADLPFTTREHAEQLPARLAARGRVDEATGVLMHLRGTSSQDARTRLQVAARNAGVSVSTAADLLIELGA